MRYFATIVTIVYVPKAIKDQKVYNIQPCMYNIHRCLTIFFFTLPFSIKSNRFIPKLSWFFHSKFNFITELHVRNFKSNFSCSLHWSYTILSSHNGYILMMTLSFLSGFYLPSKGLGPQQSTLPLTNRKKTFHLIMFALLAYLTVFYIWIWGT